jgi:hypothetical protein
MTAAVEREVSDSYFVSFFFDVMRFESISREYISLVPVRVSKYKPCRKIEILPVTVNPGDEALASEYETTRDSLKSIQNLLLQLPSAIPCARWCC